VVVPPVLSLAAPYPFPNPLLTAPHNSGAYYYDAPAAASWAYQASQPLTVSLAISGADGTPITTVVQSAFGGGSIAWNGDGATGAPVPSGVYTLTIAAQDAGGAPAPVQYNGAPTTTTVTETVLDDAASLTSPLSGSVVSGSASFGVSLSPLLPLSNGSSVCVALSSVANASTLSQNGVSYASRSGGTGEGNLRPNIPAPPQNSCVVPSGGAFAGTVDTTRVANGAYDVIASFSLSDANSGATDYYNSYVIDWVTVRNAPAFLSTPAVAANPFTPNGDGANDTFNVAFTANSDVTATLTVTDTFGNPVTSVITRAVAGQPATIAWNGTNANGLPVPDAPNYQASLTLSDAQGHTALYNGFGNIGVAATPFSPTDPLSGTTLSGTTTVTVSESPGLNGLPTSSIYDIEPNRPYHRDPSLGLQPAGAAGTTGEVIAGTLARVSSNPDGTGLYALTVDPPTALGNGSYDLYADFSYDCASFCSPGPAHEHVLLARVTIRHAPTITALTAAPNPLIPAAALASCGYYNGCAGGTTLGYAANTALTTTATVQDASGATVATLLDGVPQAPGPRTVSWNGLRDDGTALPNGVYTATVAGTDASGALATAALSLTLVSQPATAQPPSGSIVDGATPFTATIDPLLQAAGFRLYNVYLAPRPSGSGAQPYCFSQSLGQATPQADGTFSDSFDTMGLGLAAGAVYDVLAYGAYTTLAGSSQTVCAVVARYTVGNAPSVYQASVAPSVFTPGDGDLNGTADSTSASYTLNEAMAVTATVQDASGATVRYLARALTQGTGAHSLTWNGRDAGGALVAGGVYTITIMGAVGGLFAPPVQAAVTLVRAPVAASGIAAGPVVSGTTVITASLSPLLSAYSPSASALVVPAGAADLSQQQSLGAMTAQGNGLYALTWTPSLANGRYDVYVDVGYYVPGSNYYGTNEYYRIATVAVAQSPGLGSPTVAPRVLTLDAPPDGVDDRATLTLTPNQPLTVTTLISDSTGALVKTLGPAALTPNSANGGTASVTWDGTTLGGTLAAAGDYTLTVLANPADNGGLGAPPAVTTVTVVSPSLTLSGLAPGAAVLGTVPLNVTAAPALRATGGLSSIALYAAPYTTTASARFSGAIYIGSSSGNGPYPFSWDTKGLPDGDYDLFARFCAVDTSACGNYYYYGYNLDQSLLGTFTVVNNPRITAATASPNPFTPNGDGANDTTSLNLTLNRALAVTVTIADAGGTVVRRLVTDTVEQPSASISWDGLDDNGAPVPDGTYTANVAAGDDVHGVAAPPAQVSVGLTRVPLDVSQTIPPSGTPLGGTVRTSVLPSAIMAAALSPTCSTYYGYCPLELDVVPHGTSVYGTNVGDLTPRNDGSGLYSLRWDSTQVAPGLYDLVVRNSYNGSTRTERYTLGTYRIDQSSHQLTLSPAAGKPGDTVAITGTGYLSGTQVTATFNTSANASTQVGVFTTTAGAFSGTFVVPPSAATAATP